MKNDIEKLLVDYEKYHSEFQIDNFIIGKSGDDWARYKQALREISTRYKSLINMREQFEIDSFGPSFYKKIRAWLLPCRVREIYKDKRRRSRSEIVSEIAEIERELSRFIELAKSLRDRLGELTPERRRELEANSWREKAVKMAGLDLLTNGRVGSASLEFIMSLPKKDRRMVINVISPDARPDPFKLLGMNDD